MLSNSQEKKIEVIAYSGYKANERPLYFLLDQQRLEVKKVLDQWHGQDHDYFSVFAGDGRVYLLKWHRISGDLCKTSPFARFLRQTQILIIEILNVFLWLKLSSSLNSNKIEHFSKVSRYLVPCEDY